MTGPSTVIRAGCLSCHRVCELEVEHDGTAMVPAIEGLFRTGELHVHRSLCLMCGSTHPRLYWPGEIFEALQSARYLAA